MAQVDTSIYNALLQRPKSAMEWQNDYAAQDDAAQARQLNALNMREAQARAGDASMARQDQWTVRNALSGMQPDAPLQDRVKTLRGTGTPLGYTQAQELEKADLEAARVRAQTQQAEQAAASSRMSAKAAQAKAAIEKHDRAIADIMVLQSPQEAMQSLRRHAAEGSIGPAEVQAVSRQLMGLSTPEQWQQWQDQMLYKLQDAKGKAELTMKRLEWQAKQRESASTLANRDLIEDPTQPGRFIVNAPLNEAKVQRAAAGAAQAPGMTYMTDAGGNIVGLPTKAPLGRTVVANVVRDAGGTPLPGKDGGMTEDQGKASGWLAQATTAFANMEKARTGAKPGIGDFVGRVPLMGDVGNAMRPDDRQLFVQASESLSEALLRAATGAGVNRDEAMQKVRELTPQFGDSDAVIAQKRAAVPIYLKSLEARAGRKGTQAAQQATGSAGVSAPTAAPAFGLDPAAIAAELAKRGVK